MRKASSGVPAPAADTAAVDEARLPSANIGDSGVPALDRDNSLPLRVGNAALKHKNNLCYTTFFICTLKIIIHFRKY